MAKTAVPTVSREKDLLVLRLLASGRYRVDADGTVWDNNYRNTGQCHQLKTRCLAKGDWMITLATNETPRQVSVLLNRLVALAFHGDPQFPLGAVHLDGNRNNHAASNLAWMDLFEGMQTASANGSLRIYKGSQHVNAKITEAQAKEIKRLLAAGKTPTEIVRLFGGSITRALVRGIQRGASWGHI